MHKIIVSIAILFFVSMQASEKKLHICQGAINKSKQLIQELDYLHGTCAFVVNYEDKFINKNAFIESVIAGSAKRIEKMREEVQSINNPSWCIGNFSLSNYFRGVSTTHYQAMCKARLDMFDIQKGLVETKEPYTKDAADWSKKVQQQCSDCSLLLAERSKYFDAINRLYHEEKDFDSSEVQEEVRNLTLQSMKIFSSDYKDVRDFFTNQSEWHKQISEIVDSDKILRARFAQRDKDSK